MSTRVRPERPIESERDPMWAALIALRLVQTVRNGFRMADEDPAGARAKLIATPALRDAFLIDLAFAGAALARLTVLVEACGSTDPDLFLDLVDRADELHELRDQLAERRASRPRSDEDHGASMPAPLSPAGAASHDASAS